MQRIKMGLNNNYRNYINKLKTLDITGRKFKVTKGFKSHRDNRDQYA